MTRNDRKMMRAIRAEEPKGNTIDRIIVRLLKIGATHLAKDAAAFEQRFSALLARGFIYRAMTDGVYDYHLTATGNAALDRTLCIRSAA